jgi:hypothetical protein
MKNIFKVIGIIALVAVIGFSMAACEDNSDKEEEIKTGTFVLTDIPEKYNGKYATATLKTTDGKVTLYGNKSWDAMKNDWNYVKISNGKAIIPVWTSSGYLVSEYYGNDTFTDTIIWIANESGKSAIASISFKNGYQIVFNNGHAEASVNNCSSLSDWEGWQ